MKQTLRAIGVVAVALILAAPAFAQGRSGGRAGGPPAGAGSQGQSGGNGVGTPSTPASNGVGRDFGAATRDAARSDRQSWNANENAVLRANANAGLGSTATATTILDEDVAAAEVCSPAPGRSAEAAGSPFNPEGTAADVLTRDLPPAADEPIAVTRYERACANQPD